MFVYPKLNCYLRNCTSCTHRKWLEYLTGEIQVDICRQGQHHSTNHNYIISLILQFISA